jgi:hypothetical protein
VCTPSNGKRSAIRYRQSKPRSIEDKCRSTNELAGIPASRPGLEAKKMSQFGAVDRDRYVEIP